MHILLIAALYPPETLGGAETSAANLARWLARQGHDVAVLATARDRADERHGALQDGVRVWRLRTAHLYPMIAFPEAPVWQKPVWHAQDHFDPRNTVLVDRVLDAVRPDLVSIHILQGIGHNALAAIARRDIPTLYVLHDLGLACIRMSMHREGRNCESQCGLCRLSSRRKMRIAGRIPRIGFLSPSNANLATLRRFAGVDRWPNAVVANPNSYPAPRIARTLSAVPRLLYVGRLHAAKGIAGLLEILARLAGRHSFTMTVIGGGPLEAPLRERYRDCPWLRLAGQVSEEEVGDAMQAADLLLVPSVWRENWPGVVVRALGLGLPVIGSDVGGIPELVRNGANGALVAPGDDAAWERALDRVLADPSLIAGWRRTAEAERARFDQDELGRRVLAFMARIANGPP